MLLILSLHSLRCKRENRLRHQYRSGQEPIYGISDKEHLQTVNSEAGHVYTSFIAHRLYFHHSLAARFNDVISFQIAPLKG